MIAVVEQLFMDAAVMDAASFGRRLRELREAAGLDRHTLAKRAKISYHAVEKYEQGAREPLVSVVPQLATALGVPVDAFFADPAPDVPPSKRGRPKKAVDDEDD